MLLLGSSTAVDASANVPATSASHPVATAAVANGSWTVYHHDDAHTGYDSTGAAATGASAGWVSTALDGSIYAEPLVFNGIVYAVTLQGTVYAINQSTGVVAWSNHVGTPTSWSNQCGNINPLGISGTPVIDTAAGRIYVAENLSADHLWHVFGVDLSTHLVVMNTPIPVSLGTGIDWTIEQERGALALANGNVYVPFGGRAGDCGAYHGWIYAVPTSGAAVTNYYETPGQGAGFWTAGGVVVDSSTGKVFDTSGNGTSSGCNANPNGTPVFENDAVVRFSATLAHEDSFIPLDWKANWCDNDQDLGSASMVLISPTLAFQAGKWGNGFLVNPQQLGGMNGQLYPSPTNYTGVDVCRGGHSAANYGSYAYAAPYVYLSCEGNGLVALQINTTTKSFSACGVTCAAPNWNVTGFTPGSPIVAGGAVWAVDTNGGGLYGFNASTGAQIYHSSGFGVTHFTTPSEAGGQIFVGSGNVVRSFNMATTACTSVTESAAPSSPQASGTGVTFTGLASGCPHPLYQFWILPPGSSTWQIKQAYSTMNTFNWSTTGLPPGNYLYTVWARDSASTGTSCSYLGCNDAFFPGTAYTLS
jgi:PQQ-like domain